MIANICLFFKKYLMLFLMAFAGVLKAQNNIPKTDIIPPSPNAASLGKYAQIPVSLFTGNHNIDIPITEVIANGFKLPISLSYNSGGIKVEETGSWVGLGWALNAGGVITRSIMGIADETPGVGFLYTGSQMPQSYNPFPNISNAEYDYWTAVHSGTKDSQADIFYFNFGGRTGKFFLRKDAQNNIVPVIVPYQKIKINYLASGNFEAITEDGTLYRFDQTELQLSNTYAYTGVSGGLSGGSEYISSWYMSKIITPTKDSIIFQYTPYTVRNDIANTETKYSLINTGLANCSGDGQSFDQISHTMIETKAKRLSKIIANNQSIEFIEGATRCDLTGDAMLDAIQIYRTIPGRELVKEFKLAHSYGTTAVASYVCPSRVETSERLMLTSVTEENGNIKKAPYVFEYDFSQKLPSRFSVEQDHWGYYNGKSSNTTLIPVHEAQLSYFNNPAKTYFFNYANRDPSLAHARAQSLTKISYPTGGSTSFTYSLHECGTITGKFIRPELVNASFFMTSNTDDGTVIQNGVATGTTKSFTINGYSTDGISNTTGAFVRIQLSNFCTGASNDASCYERFFIRDANNTIVWMNSYGANIVRDEFFYLKNGTYTMTHSPSSNYVPSSSNNGGNIYMVTMHWQEPTNPKKYPVGGLRLAEMKDVDPVTGIQTVKRYEYKDEATGNTSGEIIYVPDYTYFFEGNTQLSSGCASGSGGENMWQYYVMSSSTTHPLATTMGSHVGYKTVTVYDGVSGTNLGTNGKTVYNYNFTYDICSFASGYPQYGYFSAFPFTPFFNLDWRRGQPDTVTTYKRIGTGFQKIKQEKNVYTIFESPNNPNLGGQTIRCAKVGQIKRGIAGTFHLDQYNVSFYYINPMYSKLTKTIETIYDPNDVTKFISTITDYNHSLNHLQLSDQSTTASNGNILKQTFKYPSDYAGTAVYDAMVSRNILSPVVEQATYKNGTSFLKSAKTNYNHWYNNAWSTANENSLLLPQTVEAKQLSNAPEVVFRYHTYNAQGNVTSLSKELDVKKTYLWGYNKAYPVAEIAGSDYATASAVINQNVLDNPVSDGALRTELAKLRAASTLSSALINTYTYKPLVGVTSQTDPNGITTFYEYDALGRLFLVKDKDGNILKKICYNYQGQVESCDVLSFSSIAKSGTYTRNNCPSGYVGSSVTYTVNAGAYSSTISQADADSKAQTDVNNNGQTFANNNGTCIESQNCTISMSPGYSSPSALASSYNNVVTLNLVFWPVGSTMYTYSNYTVGTISTGCRPSGNRSFTCSSNGRTVQVTINASGDISVMITSGNLPPYYGVQLFGTYTK
jgi:YD repeat-containing protein